jgi:hypothetical protein
VGGATILVPYPISLTVDGGCIRSEETPLLFGDGVVVVTFDANVMMVCGSVVTSCGELFSSFRLRVVA